MKKIPLTQGKFAVVDDEDYPIISLFDWCVQSNGYSLYAITSVQLTDKRLTLKMHRLIANAPDGQHVDHINNDSLDNRRKNLRFCTHAENQMNRISKTGTSEYKGVNRHQGRWRAYIKHNGKHKYLGSYDKESDAAIAYNNKALELFGEFANINALKGE